MLHQYNSCRNLLPAVALSVTFIVSSTAVSASDQTELLTNFEGTGNQLVPPYDGYIYGYTDVANGGDSTINELVITDRDSVLNPIVEREKGAHNSSGYLKISGNVTTKYQYGYAGCGFNLFADRRSKDLSGYKGIKFQAKGTGKFFIAKIEINEDVEHAFYETYFMPPEDWGAVTLYFNDFRQPSWASKSVDLKKALGMVKGIQFQTKGQPLKNYELSLDDIELIK